MGDQWAKTTLSSSGFEVNNRFLTATATKVKGYEGIGVHNSLALSSLWACADDRRLYDRIAMMDAKDVQTNKMELPLE